MEMEKMIWKYQFTHDEWEIWTCEIEPGKYIFEIRTEGFSDPKSVYHSIESYTKLKLATDEAIYLIKTIEDISSIGF